MANKTYYKKHLEWMENHPLLGRCLIAVFYLGTISLLIGLGKEVFSGYQYFFGDDPNEIRVYVQISNHLPIPIHLSEFGNTKVIEGQNGSTMEYYKYQGDVSLQPKSDTGTNVYFLKPEESRVYFIRLPTDQQTKDLIDKGASTLTVGVYSIEAMRAEGQLLLEKKTIHRQKLQLDFKMHQPN